MSNEDKVLSMLETLNTKVDAMAGEMAEMKREMTEVKRDVAEVKQEVAEVKQEVAEVKQEVAEVKQDLISVKKTLDAVYDHTAYLTERQTATDKTVDDLAGVVQVNTVDIAKLRAAR